MRNSASEHDILTQIKMKGEVTAAWLANKFEMTKEGARQHLLKLENKSLVKTISKSEGVGRPFTYYSLTEKGNTYFPDAHAQVTVELLQSVKQLLGENALDLLVTDREKQTYDRYQAFLGETQSLEERLDKLVELRSGEGYMAEWNKDEGAYYLVENHCPICAAATECQGFCRAELTNFRELIGKSYKIERVKHIIKDDHRCVYKIISV